MKIMGWKATVATVALLLVAAPTLATTRDVAELDRVSLTFETSVLSQLSNGILWEPYDELQQRPYNLTFVNIEREGNLSPWRGEEGEQKHYLNALIGNNGNNNVRNGADAIQGSWIKQQTMNIAFGVAGSYLADEFGDESVVGDETFSEPNELSGFDIRLAGAKNLNDNTTAGIGLSLYSRTDDEVDSSFETGVGGFFGIRSQESSGVRLDAGMRRFMNVYASWEFAAHVGLGTTDLLDQSDTLDDTGAITERFVSTNYEISDMSMGVEGSYNRRSDNRARETRYRGGFMRSTHDLDTTNLAFTDQAGTITPSLTLLNQDTISDMEIYAAAETIFQAGSSTQIFAGAKLGNWSTDGSTTVDSLGVIVLEEIDDSMTTLDLVVGFRQPLWNDRTRLMASGRAQWFDQELTTITDANSTSSTTTQTSTNYAIGIESVLANITFDLAWLFGDETTPFSTGARQTVEFDRLVVSAMVAW